MNILLFNNGTKYLNELKKLLGKYGTVAETSDKNTLKSTSSDVVVLSGGHKYSIVNHPDSYQEEIGFIKNTTSPVLGICLGAELIAYAFGASIEHLDHEEKGLKPIDVLISDHIFTDITDFKVYENHQWAITELSDRLEGLARSQSGFEVIRHKTRPIYGFQFHPEIFENKSDGDKIFRNLFQQYLK